MVGGSTCIVDEPCSLYKHYSMSFSELERPNGLVFPLPSGAIVDAEEAGGTDYPAGSAREGEFLEGAEQPRSNAAKGTRMFMSVGGCTWPSFRCDGRTSIFFCFCLVGERKPHFPGQKICRPYRWPELHPKGGMFD